MEFIFAITNEKTKINFIYLYIFLATLHELEPLVSDAEDRKPVEKYANTLF